MMYLIVENLLAANYLLTKIHTCLKLDHEILKLSNTPFGPIEESTIL